jgi:hypothetical protein
MQIIARNPFHDIAEHERIRRRLLAERAHEWQSLRGIRRLTARLRIGIWAWHEAARERRRILKHDSPQKL